MSWPAHDPTNAGSPEGPLTGLRILDLSRILAGPFATQVLADLGADVIKVERTGVGDETRRWGPPFAPSGDAAYFFVCNRGRRSIELDLGEDADREVILALAADADVLMENFLPGTMERLGLSDDALHARNPALVHGVISGYGHDSSHAAWPALDFVVQAHAGILAVTGPDAQTPVKAGVPVADLSAGLFCAIGVLAAVHRAQATGEGGRVEVSLVEACASLLSNQALSHLVGQTEPRPLGNVHPSIAPYQVLRAADGPLAVAVTSEEQFARLCAVLALEELAADARFASNASRVVHRAELEALLEAALAHRDVATWVEALNEAGVAAGAINTVAEVLADADIAAGLVAALPDGTPQLRTPIRLGGAPLALSSPPPRLGEHGDAIRAAVRGPNGG